MSRRKSDDALADDLFRLFTAYRWWVPVPVAVFAFAIVYAAGYLVVERVLKRGWSSSLAAELSGVASIIILVVGFFPQVKKIARKGLLRNTQGIEDARGMSWETLEQRVIAAYHEQGYEAFRMGGEESAGALRLRFARGAETILVECTNWQSQRIGPRVAREAFGVLSREGVSRAVLVTSGSFTPEAVSFAKGKPLELVDGPALVVLIRAPDVAGSADSRPPCPSCGGRMVQRESRKGASPGSQFWGCLRYPVCRGVVNA